MVHQTLICLVSLIVQHEGKVVKKMKVMMKKILMMLKCHGTEDDLEIQNNVNPDNSRSLELNIVDNIGVGVGTSSSINVHNISASTSSSNNNPLDDNDFDECLGITRKIKAMRLYLVYMTY